MQILQNWRSLVLPVLVVVVVAVAGVAMYFRLSGSEKQNVAAIVNGEVISKDDLGSRMNEIERSQGSKPEESMVLEQMINEFLLMADAKSKNISADDSEVEAEYQKTIESFGGEEQLKTRLAELGLSVDKLRQNMKNQVVINKYLETQVDQEKLAVADEDAKKAYDEVKTVNKDIPPFAEVLEQIKYELRQNKINAQLSEILGVLREKATIEIVSTPAPTPTETPTP